MRNLLQLFCCTEFYNELRPFVSYYFYRAIKLIHKKIYKLQTKGVGIFNINFFWNANSIIYDYKSVFGSISFIIRYLAFRFFTEEFNLNFSGFPIWKCVF